jgi:hypothetical protein
VALETVFSFLRDESTSLQQVLFVLYNSNTYQTYAIQLDELAGWP